MKGLRLLALASCLCTALTAQTNAPPQATPAGPISYGSISEANAVLTQVDGAAQALSADLDRVRIEKWKTDSEYKRQSLSNLDSLRRNLQDALPAMVGQVRQAPEDLSATFKLYRNLGALYDVLSSVAESAGAFGSKDEYQSLANDASLLDRARRALADRLENLASARDKEVANLRDQVRALKATVQAQPPKKIVIDDDQPKKPVPAKKPKTTKPAAATGAPDAKKTSTPAAQTPVKPAQTPPPKPQ
jgi:Skp family chaperone for outer membrane proteins